MSASEPMEQRKLAAIMFTDMVGYSALTQRNEMLALKLLADHQQLLRALFPRFHGHEIKTIGDAFLVEFPSALDATRCAVEIQTTLLKRNKEIPNEERVELRIGLHVGDVVYKENDVFGDGVNIAARIEPVARPGCICVSEDVARQIQNKIDLPLVKIGKRDLKNIDLPINIYRVVLPGEHSRPTFGERWGSIPQSIRYGLMVAAGLSLVALLTLLGPWRVGDDIAPSKTRVAVLPFLNISAAAQDEYFADGMTEEMISTLSKISGLSVIARTSVTKYKGARMNVEQIGSELMVGTVLEGSVRKAMDKARITVNLIDVISQKQLWSMDYDREIKDVFMVQSDIARRVAEALRVQLLAHESSQIDKPGTSNTEAYRAFLLGRYYLNQRTPEAVQEAAELFQRSVALDPQYALAYASLAECYALIASGFGNVPRLEIGPRAKEAALKAVALDSMLAEGHAALAYVLFRIDWNWEAAEKEFRQALTLQPSYARAHETYGLFLALIGRMDEALHHMQRALELDPNSPGVRTGLGRVLEFRGEHDKAVQQLLATIGKYPTYAEAHFALGMTYSDQDRLHEAIETLRRAAELSGGRPVILANLAAAYALIGKRKEAEEILHQLQEQSERGYVAPSILAMIHYNLGDEEQGLRLWEKALEERDAFMVYIRTEPYNKNLHRNPRFEDLLKKMNFPQ